MNLRAVLLLVVVTAVTTCALSAWYLVGQYAGRDCPPPAHPDATVTSATTSSVASREVGALSVFAGSSLAELEARVNGTVGCSDRSRETMIPGLTDIGYRIRFLSFREGWVGCFADVQPSEMTRVSEETSQPHLCAEQCRQAGYLFTSLKRPDGCYCSHTIGRHGRLSDDQCPVELAFNYGASKPEWYEPVGAVLRNAVFRVRNASLASVDGTVIAERPSSAVWGWHDYHLPVTKLPPLHELALRQHVTYGSVLGCGCRFSLRDEERLINVFLPVRGRSRNLVAVLRYLWEASIRVQPSVAVSIVVIEVDAAPHLEKVCQDSPAKPEYIFIPQEAAKVTGCGDQFPKALAYNIGYLLARKARWNLFHDVDVLVHTDFFDTLHKAYIQKLPDLQWLQPYSDYQPQLLFNDTTRVILDVAGLPEMPLFDLSRMHIVRLKPEWGIAPGGSILVRGDVFEQIGGYDPELFFGYAPEDSMLWWKLSHLAAPRHALDPPVYVWHMFHEQMLPRRHIDRGYSQLDYMNALVLDFRNGTQAFKDEFIALKHRLFRL
eukprot:TRINITY_DN358_c0_g2_i3.p1 TRINITY_DN358_c0_g2~~TRINITY_DN358_c0_g2_i3.p1  ORF type:complete len:548 (-),score=191.77 TRINITY_DN358_c0_g2_i3:200-1843(-)